jgi:hypothetical protein
LNREDLAATGGAISSDNRSQHHIQAGKLPRTEMVKFLASEVAQVAPSMPMMAANETFLLLTSAVV